MKNICPQCGGADMYIESGGIMGSIYHCKKCTYVGSFIIEGDDDLAKEIKEGKKAETGRIP
jgi:tRNA(Ile2) C34 agmatinyltransferase TiaS